MMRFKPPEQQKNGGKSEAPLPPDLPAGQAGPRSGLPSSAWITPLNVALLLLVAAGGYLLWRAWDAETKFRQAIAAAPTDGVTTYNLLQDAVRQNPYHLGYRLTYSQVNLALANTFSAQERAAAEAEASPSAQISQQTQATVQQLVDQAVREAKIAVNLSPNDAGSWQNLASFYRALLGIANGADQWAVGTYQQAIALSPTDPRFRLDLGGVLFSLGENDRALEQFSLATQLKPDWANAYYNLAQALKAKGDQGQALEALNETLRLLPADVPDREFVEKEIAELKGEGVGAEPSGRTGEITEPTEASPSAENVPPPVEVEGPPEEATSSGGNY